MAFILVTLALHSTPTVQPKAHAPVSHMVCGESRPLQNDANQTVRECKIVTSK